MHGEDDLVHAFWHQSGSRLGEITDLCLALEGGNEAAGQALKRHLHTMKGEAHMLGLRECAELVQSMEELVVRNAHGVSPEIADALLTALDAIGVMAASRGATPDGLREVLARLADLAEAGGDGVRAAEASASPAKDQTQAAEQREAAHLDPLVLSPLVHEALRLHREQQLLQPKMRELRRMLRALLAEMDPSVGLETLAERIVKTLNYGAELERRMTELNAQWSTSEFALENALDRIDETVRAAAMVSVAGLKAQVHRAGRAAASALGRKVLIQMSGDAYVDATVERSLGPALLHLVRNAVDHGIEMPEERIRLGKPPEGRVDVSIHQSDSSVRVVVTDDGRGVDRDRLRARIAERGAADASADQDDELLQRIFDHGVSTRDTATEISGRGVGLDVVARQVGAVGGNVRVESTRGLGTRFELVLPTMLRADVVVPVEVRGVRLALPARTVVGVERIREIVHGADGWRLPRGEQGSAELVPLFDLSSVLFETGDGPAIGDPAIVVQHRTGVFAARVERYDNPRALSFERIEELPIASDLVRGVAPAPDGGVFFLLDGDALYDSLRGRRSPSATVSAPKAARQRHVLVVEDAPVARELLLGLLRSFGLRVSDAADGREGLRAAQADRPDLILTDIEMPFLGGLDMIAELRRDARLAETPIVVLTTRSDEPVRERARALGVRFFLSKQRFVESELRKVIDECLAR